MTGVPIVGVESVGSAVLDATFCTDTRNAIAIGIA